MLHRIPYDARIPPLYSLLECFSHFGLEYGQPWIMGKILVEMWLFLAKNPLIRYICHKPLSLGGNVESTDAHIRMVVKSQREWLCHILPVVVPIVNQPQRFKVNETYRVRTFLG